MNDLVLTTRRGVAMISVIAVFAVSMTMLAAWTHGVLHADRQQRTERQHVQVRWLADAGLRRAAAMLHQDEDYKGETWRISAEQLALAHDATVELKIESSDGDIQLTAVARYPAGQQSRIQRTKTVTNPFSEP